jgi:hypothetical protein
VADLLRRTLASLGAVITILSLAFDTFAQQVLTTRTRPTVDVGSSGNASAPATALPLAVTYSGQQETSLAANLGKSLPSEVFTGSSHTKTKKIRPPLRPSYKRRS